jgi:predicted Zn-dependent peptidase
MSALSQYAKLGKKSRFRDVISEQRLREIKVEELTQKVKNLLQLPYEIFFYGKDFETFKTNAENFVEKSTLQIPEPRIFDEPKTQGKVFFTDYDMVQVEMSKIGRANQVNPKNYGKINVFNEYFGRGLSSIVFQELRESKSLAYSAYVSYSNANLLNKHDYVVTYIGTQANKLHLAVESMDELMKDLPKINAQFENAKNSALKQIASTRVTRTNIFFNYLNLNRLGIDYDIRKDIYEEIKNLTIDDLSDFYSREIKPVNFNVAVIGKKENLDFSVLEKLGDFEELTLEEIFGY